MKKFILNIKNGKKAYELMEEILSSDLFEDTPSYVKTSHIVMLGEIAKALSAMKKAGRDFYFKANYFMDEPEANRVYFNMGDFFEKISGKFYEFIKLLISNQCSLTIKEGLTVLDALKQLAVILYHSFEILISIESGVTQSLSFKFLSPFQKINFLHTLEKNTDFLLLYKRLTTSVENKTTKKYKDDLSYNIPVIFIEGQFFLPKEELQQIFSYFNILLLPNECIFEDSGVTLKINNMPEDNTYESWLVFAFTVLQSIPLANVIIEMIIDYCRVPLIIDQTELEGKMISVAFKKSMLGCDCCIFTSAVLKSTPGINTPNELVELITDHCSHDALFSIF